jgi:hypothetical protein
MLILAIATYTIEGEQALLGSSPLVPGPRSLHPESWSRCVNVPHVFIAGNAR